MTQRLNHSMLLHHIHRHKQLIANCQKGKTKGQPPNQYFESTPNSYETGASFISIMVVIFRNSHTNLNDHQTI